MKMKFFFYNLVKQPSTELTATNENANYPLTNLKNDSKTSVFRSTTISDSVVFDFKTIELVDSILIRGNGTYTIEANATNEWTSPAYSTTLTLNPEFGFGHKTITSQSYRFWRVSGSGSDYFELGNIFLGEFFQAGKNISINWNYNDKDLSKASTNSYGQKFFDIKDSVKAISGSIKFLTSTEMELLVDNTNYVRTNKSFWIMIDEDELFSSDKELFTGEYYFKTVPKVNNVAFGYYNTTISLMECV